MGGRTGGKASVGCRHHFDAVGVGRLQSQDREDIGNPNNVVGVIQAPRTRAWLSSRRELSCRDCCHRNSQRAETCEQQLATERCKHFNPQYVGANRAVATVAIAPRSLPNSARKVQRHFDAVVVRRLPPQDRDVVGQPSMENLLAVCSKSQAGSAPTQARRPRHGRNARPMTNSFHTRQGKRRRHSPRRVLTKSYSSPT